jgi:short-subunit dehydrogenase
MVSLHSPKYALVTGATSGIGYELAKLFAADGYNLVIVARTEADLQRTATEFSNNFSITVIPIAKDLSERVAPFEIYDDIRHRGIQIDVLVNDAAQGLFGKFVETDLQRELEMLNLNIGAYIVLTKLYLREMITRGDGKILNVASIAGKVPGPYQAVYHGTKAFIHSFTEAIRAELGDDSGISITSLLPGATDTDFFRKANMEDSKILQQELADPAKVAKDGFDALMRGDDMVISGLKNKAQIAASSITPDKFVAKAMMKQQEPRGNSN